MAETRMRGAVGATIAGMIDRVRGRTDDAELPVTDVARLDGLTVLVTGASSGLGAAVATRVAELGARTLLAQRSRHDEATARVVEATGNTDVAAFPLDLADADSIDALADRLAKDDVRVDRLILNAGVVPASARRTAAGLDVMVHTNFLGNTMLVEALLDRGVLVPDAAAPPRIVVVGSETHRSAPPIDLDTFAEPVDYPASKVVEHYGRSKLLLHTWTVELARRLVTDGGRPTVEVHHLCPGAVNSSIAREAPGWAKPIIGVAFRLFFQPPEKAAEPVVFLAASDLVAGRTGVYLHMRTAKDPAEAALDPTAGAGLFEAAHVLAEKVRA